VEGPWRIVEAYGRFEVFAGIVVEDERGAVIGVCDLAKLVDEWTRQGDLLAVAWKVVVHESFEIRFRNEGVFGSRRREEAIFHFV